MKRLTLSKLLTQAVNAVLLSPLIVAASCGGGSAVDVTAFEAPLCSGFTLALGGLKPTKEVDYIELRHVAIDAGSATGTVTSIGTKCESATNPSACDAAVTNPTIPSGETGIYSVCSQICTHGALITTRADEVKVIASKAALDAFLAPYDTTQEAVLAALTTGQSVSCTDKSQGAVRQVPGGYEVVTVSGSGCGTDDSVVQHLLFVSSSGAVSERSSYTLKAGEPNCVAGRRPAGLCPSAARRRPSDGPLGRHFASSTRLEAASVTAFRILRSELAAHGGPARLQRLAARSARDEIRHTRSMKRLAARYGTRTLPPSVQRRPIRTLEEIVCENAAEGCVRETLGALVAQWRARRAQDPAIARAMARLARDEARHAAL
ncbi:MAG TPA: ferritin-like domain-containing protein, partial [Pseudomonadota bacterium]|nr:ferritin-like domain-containing protein [Pseudomonadota bacterium]